MAGLRTCFVCRRTKPLHRFGKAIGRFRVCLRCRAMLEGRELTPGSGEYIKQRLLERGVSRESVESLVSPPRSDSLWEILKDIVRGVPKSLK